MKDIGFFQKILNTKFHIHTCAHIFYLSFLVFWTKLLPELDFTLQVFLLVSKQFSANKLIKKKKLDFSLKFTD